MEAAVGALLNDLERSGPESVGPPLRGVATLVQDIGDLFSADTNAFARRRRRATAARLARGALSLATAVHGAVADRPDGTEAWTWNCREAARRVEQMGDSVEGEACARVLGRIAALALALPALADEGDWQTNAIAFGDEGVLVELHGACLELAAVAVRLASANS